MSVKDQDEDDKSKTHVDNLKNLLIYNSGVILEHIVKLYGYGQIALTESEVSSIKTWLKEKNSLVILEERNSATIH